MQDDYSYTYPETLLLLLMRVECFINYFVLVWILFGLYLDYYYGLFNHVWFPFNTNIFIFSIFTQILVFQHNNKHPLSIQHK